MPIEYSLEPSPFSEALILTFRGSGDIELQHGNVQELKTKIQPNTKLIIDIREIALEDMSSDSLVNYILEWLSMIANVALVLRQEDESKILIEDSPLSLMPVFYEPKPAEKFLSP